MMDQDTTTTTESSTETTPVEQTDTSSTTSTTAETTEATADETVDLAADDTTDTTETVEDTRTDEEKAADEARAELFGAPAEGEEYTIEGLPEGMTIDQEALADVTPVARELNLSSQGLSKIAGVYAEKVLPRVAQQVTTGIEQDIIAQRKTWEDEARDVVKSNGQELKNAAGETLSFDAKPLEEVRRVAAKALDRIAPQGFREWLKETGLSVHPQMVAFTYQAGKLLAEDTDLERADTKEKDQKSSQRRVSRAGGLDPDKFYDRG